MPDPRCVRCGSQHDLTFEIPDLHWSLRDVYLCGLCSYAFFVLGTVKMETSVDYQFINEGGAD